MAIEINKTQNIDKNYVRIDVSSKNFPTRSFKVPKNTSDEFCKNYKQFNRDQNIWSIIRISIPTLIACGIANYFTKNMNKAINWSASIGAGLVSSFLMTNLNNKMILTKENKLINKHYAQRVEN